MVRGGKHGDDDVRALYCLGGGRSGSTTACRGLFYSLQHKIECTHLMSRLGEVRRHPAAHVPQADECDLCHYSTPRDRLSALPIPRSFFDEGGHSFFLVVVTEQAVEQAPLEADALAQRDLEGCVHHLLDGDCGERWHCGNGLGGLHRLVEQLVGGDDLCDDGRSLRFRCVHHPPGQAHFHRLGLAHRPG